MAKDPYQYFRVEARELLDVLTRSLLQAEKGESDRAVVTKLLRMAHTLKGAAQVVKQTAIGEAAHAIEDILAPYRESPAPLPPPAAGAALRLVGQIASRMAALQPVPESASRDPVPRSHATEPLDTVRVDVNDVESLLSGLSELGVQLRAARQEAHQVRRAKDLARAIAQDTSRAPIGKGANQSQFVSSAGQLLTTITRAERGLALAAERAERELEQCRETANRLRLLPVEILFPSLARAVREAAVALGKQVEFETSGASIRLDADVLTVLQDALLHLVRNAVAHGIEEPGIRIAAGKSAIGKATLQVKRRGNRISFLCQDDGAGIDLAAIRRVAVEKGVVSASDAEPLELRKAIDLILHAGLSTSDKVTSTSGRGIGLEIVCDCAQRLKGEVSIETAPGLGTTVEICVPASLTSVSALLVQSGGVLVGIPLEAVRQSLRIGAQDIARSAAGESVPFEDEAIPFLALSEVLGQSGPRANGRERKTAVVVSAGGAAAAVGVEKLLGASSVLVRSLPAIAAAKSVVAGASLDAEGNPLLVLDAAPLIEAIRKGGATAKQASECNPPVLIVDDSLTTRMVEQNILESAGYEVETATSGEEALRMARLRKHSLFLVDIEMPGMDGFEFISQTHNDPLLRDVPSILVSSRSSPTDKRHGEEVGARAYFAKNEFDQTQFLETVAHLSGVDDGKNPRPGGRRLSDHS